MRQVLGYSTRSRRSQERKPQGCPCSALDSLVHLERAHPSHDHDAQTLRELLACPISDSETVTPAPQGYAHQGTFKAPCGYMVAYIMALNFPTMAHYRWHAIYDRLTEDVCRFPSKCERRRRWRRPCSGYRPITSRSMRRTGARSIAARVAVKRSATPISCTEMGAARTATPSRSKVGAWLKLYVLPLDLDESKLGKRRP